MGTQRVDRLPSGLVVVTDPVPSVESVAIGVWVGAGTRYEAPEINGTAHLLEHMAFKGTRRRSAQAIAEEIEAVGGHMNAYTSRETTGYYVKLLKEDWRLGLDLLADILQNSTLDETELDRERAVVLQEIGQAYDTPDDIVFDEFQAAAFPDQGLGRPVLGTTDIVGGLSREALSGFMQRHYGAGSMVLAVSGNIDPDAILAEAAVQFGALAGVAPAAPDAGRYGGGELRRERELEQTHLVLGFEAVGHYDPDFYAYSVFSTLLGGGMSSRLFQEIRERRGLVYSIFSFFSAYRDTGLFGVYAGTGEREVAELTPVLCEELARVADTLTVEEIDRARQQIKASLLMGLESPMSRAEQAANQILVFGRPHGTAEILAKLNAVDAEAVARVARRLTASRPTLAAIGPLGSLEPLDRIAERLVR